ncbi:MAG: acyl carrier protein, partial [Limnospira sp. PMC 1261.20]
GAPLTGYRAATRNVAGTIDILHEIHDGALVAFVNFDAHCFDQTDIEAFAQEHAATLRALAAESCKATKAAVAASPARDSDVAPVKPTDGLHTALTRIAAGIITHPPTAIDPQADLEGSLGLDSLGRIRLVNAVIGNWPCRDRAKRLVGCRTLAEMAAIIAETVTPEASAQ